MKRFVIPAFFVVDAFTEAQAEQRANEMRHAANDVKFSVSPGEHYCLFDEEAKNVEIPRDLGEELPHTYFNLRQHLPDPGKCACGEDH